MIKLFRLLQNQNWAKNNHNFYEWFIENLAPDFNNLWKFYNEIQVYNYYDYYVTVFPQIFPNNTIPEFMLEYISKNTLLTDIIDNYITSNFDNAEIIKNICGFFPENSYKQSLEAFILLYIATINKIKNNILFNSETRLYEPYLQRVFNNLQTKQEYLELAKQSIYYKTQKLATAQEIEKEFNTDFRFQKNKEGYIAPIFNNDYNIDYTHINPEMRHPANMNYFMLGQGMYVRSQVADNTVTNLYEAVGTNRKWIGENVISYIHDILGIQIYILQTYNQNFMYRYQLYNESDPDLPIIVINYTSNHYETCGIEDQEIITYFQVESPYWIVLKDYDRTHTIMNGNEVKKLTAQEWYTLNKDRLPAPTILLPLLKNPLPLPKNLPTKPLPTTQTSRIPLSLAKIQKYIIDPNKLDQANKLAQEYGLNINKLEDIKILYDNRSDLFMK